MKFILFSFRNDKKGIIFTPKRNESFIYFIQNENIELFH
jgi:hypothetical protein